MSFQRKNLYDDVDVPEDENDIFASLRKKTATPAEGGDSDSEELIDSARTLDAIKDILGDSDDDDLFKEPQKPKTAPVKRSASLLLNPNDLFASLEHKRKIIEAQRTPAPRTNKLMKLLESFSEDGEDGNEETTNSESQEHQAKAQGMDTQRKSHRPLPALPKEAQARMKAQSISFAWLIDDEKAELPAGNDECAENPSETPKTANDNSHSISSPKKSGDEVACASSITETGKKDNVQKRDERAKSRMSSKSKQKAAAKVQPEKPLFTIIDGQAKSIDKTLLKRLAKYREELEALSTRSAQAFNATKQQILLLSETAQNELRKYKSWGLHSIVKKYRSVTYLRCIVLYAEKDILFDKVSILQKKIAKVRCLYEMIANKTQIKIEEANPNNIVTEDMKHLMLKKSYFQAMLDQNNIELNKQIDAESKKDQREELIKILDEYSKHKVSDYYYEPDDELQNRFDSWFFDMRKVEGREASKVLRLLQSQPSKPNNERVNPEDIPGFIMNFSREIKNQESISQNDSEKELFFLISRSLFPKCSTALLSLSDFDVNKADTEYIKHIETLRKNPPNELTAKGNVLLEHDPHLLDKAITILSDLPFQMTPSDMISVIEKAINAICTSAQHVCGTNVGADDIMPLVAATLFRTELPNISEVIFAITRLSTEDERSHSFGWAAITFEIAFERLKQLVPEKN